MADDAEAEDVVQEAYLDAYRSLASFRGEASFATWLTRIAVYEALARARARRRFVALPAEESFSDDPAPGASPERLAASGELGEAVVAEADALPPPLRSVFVLRDIEGLGTEETAAALGLSVANVRVRLHRARAALRQGIDRRVGSEIRRLYAFAGERCDRLTRRVMEQIAGE